MELKSKIPFDVDMLIDFFKNQPVRKVYLFGSYARGDYRQESDVDILVELERRTDLFRFIKIKLQLEALLQKTVDLISANGLSHRIKPTIDTEKILIYEKNEIFPACPLSPSSPSTRPKNPGRIHQRVPGGSAV